MLFYIVIFPNKIQGQSIEIRLIMKDYYSLLGLERNATKAEIKKNYRLLVTKFHPDKNSDPGAAAKFIAITEAYDVLNNKKTRAKYDLFRWEQLKRQQTSEDSFGSSVPPLESTRTRRNKAQQKRGLKYQQNSSKISQLGQLGMESFYIVGRYVPHLLGVTLLVVILTSVFSHLSPAFEKALLQGIFFCVLIVVIVYGVIWLLQNVFLELRKDVEAFSIFYKIAQQKVVMITLVAFTFVLLLYVMILKTYF